ncbi:MAG TPA: hypothetical protein VFA04_17795 [Bryobacteraceae bacterium]|nr:hypothetical protein [Bryobacteraceae bacterium]
MACTLTVVFLSSAAAAIVPVAADTSICADDIIARMMQADDARDRSLKAYTAVRHYTLRGEKGRTGEMTVRLDYDSASGKKFEILAANGADGLYRRVFDKVLQAEVETSRRTGQNDSSISSRNYKFQLLGQEMRDGRRCYVIQLLPKRKSKYLIDGKAWIDEQDYALVRLEGRTAGSVSFWVGKPYIVQCYRKVGNYWLAATNDSIANAKIVGRMELTIQSSDYSVPGMSSVQVAEKAHQTDDVD